MEPWREGSPQIVPLDGGEKFDEHLLGDVLGQVVVARDSVSGPEYCLVMELKENPQGIRLLGLTLTNSLCSCNVPPFARSGPYFPYSIYSFRRGERFILQNESGRG